MSDSILITIKKMLGLDAEYTVFDTDIIVFIKEFEWRNYVQTDSYHDTSGGDDD